MGGFLHFTEKSVFFLNTGFFTVQMKDSKYVNAVSMIQLQK